jgi:ubiquinone/menaquinone biosynthesis C-methylase UbiE
MAKRLTPNATFSTGMAEALPLQDASVDLALSTSSFHHWQDQVAGILLERP